MHDDIVMRVAFSPDGRTILTGCGESAAGVVRLWDAVTQRPHRPRIAGSHVDIAELGPDGKTLLTVSADGSARLWDAATGQPVGAALPHPGAVNAVAYSPDGKFLVAGSLEGTTQCFVAATGKPDGEPMRPIG